MIFSAYKSYLAGRMHLETIERSYHELEGKNRALRESYEQLKELDQMKTNFLATVSHELRTPLTSIIGYSEMLADDMAGVLPVKAKDQVGIILEKAETLLGLINNLLDLSKIEAGHMDARLGEVDLQQVFDAAMDTIRPLAQRKDITVECSVGRALARVHCDKGMLRQILVNLLSNSIKFTSEGGRVRLQARRRRREGEAGFEVAVEDTGIGIPKDKLSRIFEHFVQVDNTSTRDYGGTGLGLSIVRSFAEAHGGDVSVTSTEGKGTTFRVWFPTHTTQE
jgi:signal transduction histidine kinase